MYNPKLSAFSRGRQFFLIPIDDLDLSTFLRGRQKQSLFANFTLFLTNVKILF